MCRAALTLQWIHAEVLIRCPKKGIRNQLTQRVLVGDRNLDVSVVTGSWYRCRSPQT